MEQRVDIDRAIEYMEDRVNILNQLGEKNEWDSDDFVSHLVGFNRDARQILKLIYEVLPTNTIEIWIPFLKAGTFNYAIDMCMALLNNFIQNGQKEPAQDAVITAIAMAKQVVEAIAEYREPLHGQDLQSGPNTGRD